MESKLTGVLFHTQQTADRHTLDMSSTGENLLNGSYIHCKTFKSDDI